VGWLDNLSSRRASREVRELSCGKRKVSLPLHKGFDELIVSGAEGRQRFGIAQHLDSAGYAGVASDQPDAFERKHHLVNLRRRHLKESLLIGFGRRPAEPACRHGYRPSIALLGPEAGYAGGGT
jgi:hypothetical protein